MSENKSKNQRTVTCDECKHEFPLESVKIQELPVRCENEELSLMFFTCPKCNKIYRVLLKDARYEELRVDLEKAKDRIRRNRGSNNVECAGLLNSMVSKKAERLEQHHKKLSAKYNGTFTFEASENNSKETIRYLP